VILESRERIDVLAAAGSRGPAGLAQRFAIAAKEVTDEQ
jgi:hypothetical protein